MIFVLIVLLVPLVTAVGILISPWWPFIKIVNRKKFACLITIGVLASAFTCFFFYLGATRNLYSKEVWNFKITSITHEEKWTEEEMRTRQVATGTDSKGDTTYTTEIYYVTESYGPYWKKYDEYDDVSYISQETYNRWKNKWKNEKRIGIHKGSAAGWDKAISGQIFQCDWPRTLLTIYPNQKITKYKNKVRASRTSIFKLPKPSKQLKKQFPRPADEKNTSPLITYGPKFNPNDVFLLEQTNAFLGKKYQIHTILVAFKASVGRDVIRKVLTAWEWTNKNELVTFVGIDENSKVQWCETHSWMDNKTIEATIRDKIINQKIDLKYVSKLLLDFVPKYWDRKHFKDFDYLQIDIHWAWGLAGFMSVVLIMLVTFLLVEYKIFEDVDVFGNKINKRRKY